MPHEYLFQLDKGTSIGGYVRDEAGRALENVKLSIYSTNALLESKQNVRDLESFDSWVYAQTDRSGRWAATATGSSGQSAIATVRSGETTSVKIGGTGRPVIGRIVVSGPDPSVTPTIVLASLASKLPDDAPKATDGAAFREWMESEAGRAQTRRQRSYSLRLEADGSFRLEDIPAGTYVLTVTGVPDKVVSVVTGTLDRATTERLTREIVVPEMPGGRSDDPLDLSVIKLQIPARK